MKKGLIALALIFVGVMIATFFISKPHHKSHSVEELGFWVDLKGEVQVRKPQTEEFADAKVDQSIVSTEIARTGPEARAVFEILGGVRFEISEESRILFEKQKNEKTRITLLDGSLRYTGVGDLSYVEVARQGQLLSPEEIKTSEVAAKVQVIPNGTVGNLVVPTEAEVSDEPKDDAPSASVDAESRITISQDEILSVLSVRLGQFKKCYLNLIQRRGDEKINAHVLISFLILANGNVEDARVWKSTVDDKLFLGCLAEVISRTRYKPFKGDSIRVDEFPLDFN